MSSEPRLVRTKEDDGVACLVLKNPPVNALSRAVLEELGGQLAALAAEPELRAVVLAGDGANFSAGADLKEMASIDLAEAPAMLRRAL